MPITLVLLVAALHVCGNLGYLVQLLGFVCSEVRAGLFTSVILMW